MDIDLGTAIIGAVLIFICILPFAIMYYKRVKNENKMLQALKEFAEQNKSKIDEHECCGDFIIGFDKDKKQVLFFKQIKERTLSQLVELSAVKNCSVQQKGRAAGAIGVTKQVELSFSPKDKNKAEIKLPLYEEEVNAQLSGELQLADKWSKTINTLLKN